MTARDALLLASFALFPVTDVGADVPGGRLVRVRVYDAAGVPAGVRDEALAGASAALREAAIDIAWVTCPADCGSPLDPGDLVLRFVRGPRPPARGAAAPLGDAFVDPVRRDGVLATVYVDRVKALATSAGAAVAPLLGHAIAHEIGHLLLASTEHSDHGLMRPVWSHDELRRARREDWMFTGREIALIRGW
jgi:hypothetical protein